MIKAVLFDYGGVLTTAGQRGGVVQEISAHFGIEPAQLQMDDLEEQLRCGFISSDEFFSELNRRHPSDNPYTPQHFLDSKDEIASRSMEIYEIAEGLRNQNIRTGILSNVFGISADRLRELGCYDEFEPVILSSEIGIAKPNSGIYNMAVEKLELKPEEVVFIDDEPKNLEPAKALGMLTIHFYSARQLHIGLPALIERFEES